MIFVSIFLGLVSFCTSVFFISFFTVGFFEILTRIIIKFYYVTTYGYTIIRGRFYWYIAKIYPTEKTMLKAIQARMHGYYVLINKILPIIRERGIECPNCGLMVPKTLICVMCGAENIELKQEYDEAYTYYINNNRAILRGKR